jgi:hypothetical protein
MLRVLLPSFAMSKWPWRQNCAVDEGWGQRVELLVGTCLPAASGGISTRQALFVDQIRSRQCHQIHQAREVRGSSKSGLQTSPEWDMRVRNRVQGIARG